MFVLEKHFLLKELVAVLTVDIVPIIVAKFYEDLKWCLQSEGFIDDQYLAYVMEAAFKVVKAMPLSYYTPVINYKKNIFMGCDFGDEPGEKIFRACSKKPLALCPLSEAVIRYYRYDDPI